jgi:TetR/AcrR family transcriptional repressor of nem operon
MGRKNQTAEKILAAAEPLVLQQGFAGTSLDDILVATGLTKGAFFHHFKGKADFARALAERYQRNHQALFERMAAEADRAADDPLDATLQFLRRFEDFIGGHAKPRSGCVFAAYTYEDAQFDEPLRDFIAASLKGWSGLYAARFGAILARYQPKIAISAVELAEMIVTLIEGALILSRSYGDARLVARQSRQFRNYLELLFADREPVPATQG